MEFKTYENENSSSENERKGSSPDASETESDDERIKNSMTKKVSVSGNTLLCSNEVKKKVIIFKNSYLVL